MSIDYQSIIEQLDDEKVKHLLDQLKIDYSDKGEYLLMPTVCHHSNDEEASEKLYYYKNTHLFVCWTECGNMSIFTFLKNFYTARNIQYDWFTDIYELILGCTYFREQELNLNAYSPVREDYVERKARSLLPEYPKEILDCFIKYYPIEWLNDGISKISMDKFNIRYSPTQNKIIIPHYDAQGRLVGIRGRALNLEEVEMGMKYMPIQLEGKWYSHPLGLNLYGLNFTKDNIKKTGIVYIGEGEKFVLQLDSFNIPNCAAAVCGSKISKYIVDILIRECQPKEIVICFDKEEKPHEDKYFNHLYELCKKYNKYCNFSFIYDKENILNLKDSPTDKGEEVFKYLLKRRVKI